jgi:hypothetical protein
LNVSVTLNAWFLNLHQFQLADDETAPDLTSPKPAGPCGSPFRLKKK